MCHESVLKFGRENLSKEDVEGKKVLEVGSLNVNGSLREYVKLLHPASYTGVDIRQGPGVDMICNAEDLLSAFRENTFDLVICTETLEHIRDWKKAVSNIKKVCKENGLLLITARSFGFPVHDEPDDYWRFEMEDMIVIFCDFIILIVIKDSQAHGIFLKSLKPSGFKEFDWLNYQLFNIKENKRIKQ